MKKSYIVLLVIFVSYLLLMLVLFYNKDEKSYQEKEREKISENYFPLENKKVKENSISNNATGLEELKQQLELANIGGYTSFVPVLYEVNKLSSQNLNYLKKYVSNENDLNNLSLNQKVIFDFDSDKKNEQLIIASNLNDGKAKRKFSIVYYIDEKINVVIENKFTLESDNILKYELVNIADLNNDGLYEIILQISTDYTKYNCYNLYELKNGNYAPVIQCSYGTTT